WERSKVISKLRPLAWGMSEVDSPEAVTYRGTFHQWFTRGVLAMRTLPTTWAQSWRVSRVAFHSATGSAGHAGAVLVVSPWFVAAMPAVLAHRRAWRRPRAARGARIAQQGGRPRAPRQDTR